MINNALVSLFSSNQNSLEIVGFAFQNFKFSNTSLFPLFSPSVNFGAHFDHNFIIFFACHNRDFWEVTCFPLGSHNLGFWIIVIIFWAGIFRFLLFLKFWHWLLNDILIIKNGFAYKLNTMLLILLILEIRPSRFQLVIKNCILLLFGNKIINVWGISIKMRWHLFVHGWPGIYLKADNLTWSVIINLSIINFIVPELKMRQIFRPYPIGLPLQVSPPKPSKTHLISFLLEILYPCIYLIISGSILGMYWRVSVCSMHCAWRLLTTQVIMTVMGSSWRNTSRNSYPIF